MSDSESKHRVMSVRQDADQADEMDMVARVDGVSSAELIRIAVSAHIAARRADPEFQARLRERIAADQRILDRLGQ